MRYKTIPTQGGPVVQSGLDIRSRDNPYNRSTPRLGIYRGLVVNTYTPDDDDNRRGQVECDVLLVRTHSILLRVPVMQRAHGINEAHGLWTPRASTHALDGSELRFSVLSDDGRYEGPATKFDNTDGDFVAIQFVEGDPDYPIITGALTHEQSNRVVRQGDGWSEGSDDRGNPYSEEYYLHHQGTEFRVNAQGDLLIDSVGAYQDRDSEDNSASGGDVRVRVKDGQRLTIAMGNDEDVLEIYKEAGQVRVDLGANASERLVLGDTFLNLFNGHTHTGVLAGMTNSGPPTLLLTDSILSDLAKTKKL